MGCKPEHFVVTRRITRIPSLFEVMPSVVSLGGDIW
jgi:hypothetical protein